MSQVAFSSDSVNATDAASISAQSAFGWFAVFTAIDKISEAALKTVIPQKWKSLSKDAQIQTTSGITSTVHAVTICAWILSCCFFDEKVAAYFNTPERRVLGSYEEFVEIFSFLTGFILYDMTILFRKSKLDPAFLAHHMAVLVSAAIVSTPFTLYGTTVGILLELSTPLLNLRNLLLNFGYKGTKILSRVEQLFGLSFVAVRLVWGVPFSIWCIYEALSLYSQYDTLTKLAFFVVLSGNLTLNGLNVMWTRKMVRMALNQKKPKKA